MKSEWAALARHRFQRARETFQDFEKRLDTDYEDFSAIDQKEAETVRQDVERFLQICEQVLEARFSNSKGSTNG